MPIQDATELMSKCKHSEGDESEQPCDQQNDPEEDKQKYQGNEEAEKRETRKLTGRSP